MTESSKKPTTEYVPRILQLDAESFDNEIKTILHRQLSEVTRYLKPGTLDAFKSEINLILNLLIFKYSLVNKNATFGQDVFNLKYKSKLSSIKLTAFALLNYVLPYLTSKFEDRSIKSENKMLKKMTKRIHVFFQACTVLNLLVFLREGKYPTLVDRILKLQYAPGKPINTYVGYNYMVKELLWQGFMMFLTNVVPFINMSKMKRRMVGIFQKKSNKMKIENVMLFNKHTKCVICNESPTVPCQISVYCPHVACYYCLKSNILADSRFACPVCGEVCTSSSDIKLTLLNWREQQLCLRLR